MFIDERECRNKFWCYDDRESTVEPLNKGHLGAQAAVPYSEVVPYWEVCKIPKYCAWAYILFNSTAEKLEIYSDFRYVSRIFPTLFSQLISIFIRLLYTFSMGAKTRAWLTQERTVRLRYAQLLSLSSLIGIYTSGKIISMK